MVPPAGRKLTGGTWTPYDDDQEATSAGALDIDRAGSLRRRPRGCSAWFGEGGCGSEHLRDRLGAGHMSDWLIGGESG
ncbi:hypothetical protein ACGFYI_33090, partial [Streptomyces rubiginosohelvolus]